MKKDSIKKELKAKKKEDLQKTASELKEKLRRLRFDLAAGKVKNVSEVKKIKKEVALIFTLLNQKEKQE